MSDNNVDQYTVLRGNNEFQHVIHYTFAWLLPPHDLDMYLSPVLTHIVKESIINPQLCVVFFTGSLHAWLTYLGLDKPTAFKNVVRNQLINDGYKLTLQEQKCLP